MDSPNKIQEINSPTKIDTMISPGIQKTTIYSPTILNSPENLSDNDDLLFIPNIQNDVVDNTDILTSPNLSKSPDQICRKKENNNKTFNSDLKHSTSQTDLLRSSKSTSSHNESLDILICSENVPPQVNGIARRIGHYVSGLTQLGHNVSLIHPEPTQTLPHVNPWNFTAKMMILKPRSLYNIVKKTFDVIHVVLPLNLSGMWILASFMVKRTLLHDCKPALVVSWHVNLTDYMNCHAPFMVKKFAKCTLRYLCWILPQISDRVLTPTAATDPEVIALWSNSVTIPVNDKSTLQSSELSRTGICHTGIQKGQFHPDNKYTSHGESWQQRKHESLAAASCQHVILCVSRLSPEKGIDELIHAMKFLHNCILWLVGDGPAKYELEQLCIELEIQRRVIFWGYQKGASLYAVYSVVDLFVCPSCTETFGQTVNEALASQVRVTLPQVPVFVEAYSYIIPQDAFWKPLDRGHMRSTIQLQLTRIEENNKIGIPDLSKLKSWEEACQGLVDEYKKASKNQLTNYKQQLCLGSILYLPLWLSVTIMSSTVIFGFSQLRSLFGGSVRTFIHHKTDDFETKIKLIKTNSMDNLESKLHSIHDNVNQNVEKLKHYKQDLEEKMDHQMENIKHTLEKSKENLESKVESLQENLGSKVESLNKIKERTMRRVFSNSGKENFGSRVESLQRIKEGTIRRVFNNRDNERGL